MFLDHSSGYFLNGLLSRVDTLLDHREHVIELFLLITLLVEIPHSTRVYPLIFILIKDLHHECPRLRRQVSHVIVLQYLFVSLLAPPHGLFELLGGPAYVVEVNLLIAPIELIQLVEDLIQFFLGRLNLVSDLGLSGADDLLEAVLRVFPRF